MFFAVLPIGGKFHSKLASAKALQPRIVNYYPFSI
jgi:hypothetical protein